IANFIDTGENEWSGEKILVVSTCPELSRSERGVSIHINRLVDFTGEYFYLRQGDVVERLPVGPRPGHASLQHQAECAVRAASGRRIVLAEDGIFSGDTLLTVIGALQEAGGRIAGIVTGFRFQFDSNAEIDRTDIPVHVVHPEIKNLVDWI